MSRLFLFTLLVSLTVGTLSAQRLVTRSGHIWFFSHTVVEDIEAHNYQTSSILDTKSGDLVFSLLIKGFQFEKALMQEHFNEKYMESTKFPKSTFKGKIQNLEAIDLSKDGEYSVNILGEITIHGVTKPIEAKGLLVVTDKKVKASSDFTLQVADYKIKIPGIVKDNIAESIDIHVEMDYSNM